MFACWIPCANFEIVAPTLYSRLNSLVHKLSFLVLTAIIIVLLDYLRVLLYLKDSAGTTFALLSAFGVLALYSEFIHGLVWEPRKPQKLSSTVGIFLLLTAGFFGEAYMTDLSERAHSVEVAGANNCVHASNGRNILIKGDHIQSLRAENHDALECPETVLRVRARSVFGPSILDVRWKPPRILTFKKPRKSSNRGPNVRLERRPNQLQEKPRNPAPPAALRGPLHRAGSGPACYEQG